jgi:hypothetical protein
MTQQLPNTHSKRTRPQAGFTLAQVLLQQGRGRVKHSCAATVAAAAAAAASTASNAAINNQHSEATCHIRKNAAVFVTTIMEGLVNKLQ